MGGDDPPPFSQPRRYLPCGAIAQRRRHVQQRFGV